MSQPAASTEAPASSHTTHVTVIEARGLRIGPYLREFLQNGELLYFFVWRSIKIRYKQTLIGASWAVLQPFMTMIVFTLFFGRLAKMPSDGLPYPVFYYCALVPWTYFANSLNNTTNTMVQHQEIIKKIYFPRLMLPVSVVLAGLIDFLIAFVLLIIIMLYYGITPGWHVIWLPVFLALAVLTALALGLWLTTLNALYRDVRYAVPFLVQLAMFASPVAYPASMVPERFQLLYALNPMTGVLEGFRWALTGQGQAPGAMMLASTAVVLVLLVTGFMYFRRMEGVLADLV